MQIAIQIDVPRSQQHDVELRRNAPWAPIQSTHMECLLDPTDKKLGERDLFPCSQRDVPAYFMEMVEVYVTYIANAIYTSYGCPYLD